MDNSQEFFRGWKFKPWKPSPSLPPEGEWWVWKYTPGVQRAIGYLDRSYDGGGVVFFKNSSNRSWIPLERARPIHPYINQNNLHDLPSLKSVPNEEIVIGISSDGQFKNYQRIGDNVSCNPTGPNLGWEYTDENVEMVRVFSRPNAAKALKTKWPEIFEDLPKGVYASWNGYPADRLGHAPPTSDPRSYRLVNPTTKIPIDLDSGQPLIIGELVDKEW